MPQKFVNLENLTSFWGNAKEYIDNERQEIEDQLYNWQKTEKASLVQCEPVPNSELHPVVEFKFKETLPEGEKGFNNPSTVTGINNIALTQTGKNVFYIPYSNTTRHGVTLTKNSDGSYTLNGQSTLAHNDYAQFQQSSPSAIINQTLPQGTTFKMKFIYKSGTVTKDPESTRNYVVALQSSTINTDGAYGYDSVTEVASEVSRNYSGKKYIGSTIIIAGTCTYNNYTFYPVFEFTNSEITNFEAPVFNNYTINLNDTYYGGFIDLSTGVMTVTHKYLTINFMTAVDAPNSSNLINCRFWPSNVAENLLYDSISTCLEFSQNPNNIVHTWSVGSKSQENFTNPIYVRFDKSDFDFSGAVDPNNPTATETRALVNNYLSSNPLHFVLPYEFPKTVQLTPIQIKSLSSLEGTSKRINTIYTDTDSIQVEYQKYVGIDSTLDNNSVNAIQNKAVNSALNTKVSLSGDETISGTKTFSNTINGNITGDAGTVAGHIVSKDVPVNAAFTDTTYDPATQSTAGLMSASDKVKLDAVGSVFNFKGSIVNSSSLPASNNTNGDAYLAEDTGHVHVYDGTSFVDIGVWAGIPSATDAQIDALFED